MIMGKTGNGTEFDVIVIGGGATGAGTARDCAMRGLRVLLLERFDYTNGATGRNHGLLHSGARYAVNDGESAAECIRENRILRRIASHCVEENGGLFISLPEDDLSYQDKFVESCRKAGIEAEAIDPKEAIRLEPSVNPSLTGAVKVPDGSIDPFRLTIANILDARAHGAVTLTYQEVTGFIREQDRIVGVQTYNSKTKERTEFRAAIVVNASGIWGHHIAGLAGVTVNMYPAKGALLIFGHRVNNMVLNRCRKAADADILVPGDTITVIGTTSTRIPYEEIDHMHVTADEVDLLLTEGEKLAPALADTRILRAYAGVRPLVAADNDPTGRNISRGIVLLDHASRDGLEGFLTITGGKLVTYRLMAEWATDLVCKKLRVNAVCRTADEALPGSRLTKEEERRRPAGNVYRAAESRHGELAGQMDLHEPTTTASCVNAKASAWVKPTMHSAHWMQPTWLRCAAVPASAWEHAKANSVPAGLPGCWLRRTIVPKRPSTNWWTSSMNAGKACHRSHGVKACAKVSSRHGSTKGIVSWETIRRR